MQLKVERLAGHLVSELAPIYVVCGDEPLLRRDARDAIVRAAEGRGHKERRRLEVQRGFDWGEFRVATQSMSLFAERQIVELGVGTGRIGDSGANALRQYAAHINADVLLLVVGERFDRDVFNSAWLKAIKAVGVVIQVWPMARGDLIRWLRARAKALGFSLDEAAGQLLADLTEGNAIAAAQELEKIGLLHAEGAQVGREQIVAATGSSARYSAFDLIEAALQKDLPRYSRVLRVLRETGTDPMQILGAVQWRLRQGGSERGRTARDFSIEKVWRALEWTGEVERRTKGVTKEDPWLGLLDMGLYLADGPAVGAPSRWT